jgi:hypothetical protein
MTQDNRESWLNRVAAGMAPLFEALDTPLPAHIRVAIGFTSAGRKGKAIGECWDNRLSADGHFEIFIRPDLAHAADAMPAQIAAILAHELVHAAVGIPAGHGRGRLREGAKSYAKDLGQRYSPVRLMCSHPSGETWARRWGGTAKPSAARLLTTSPSFIVFQNMMVAASKFMPAMR